ncbi:MAG: NACalpha-BTF3-like transcription factor [Granulosicoccus sp.]|jgi:NACalpha-BTF3-like transcription factor
MRKNIDIDEKTLTKLKMISAFENLSVKGLMEKAVEWFVQQKEKERFDNLTQEEKEDIGLLILMQQADLDDTVSREEVFKALNEK